MNCALLNSSVTSMSWMPPVIAAAAICSSGLRLALTRLTCCASDLSPLGPVLSITLPTAMRYFGPFASSARAAAMLWPSPRVTLDALPQPAMTKASNAISRW